MDKWEFFHDRSAVYLDPRMLFRKVLCPRKGLRLPDYWGYAMQRSIKTTIRIHAITREEKTMVIQTIIISIIIIAIFLLSYLYFTKGRKVSPITSILLGMIEAGLAYGVIINVIQMRDSLNNQGYGGQSSNITFLSLTMTALLLINDKTLKGILSNIQKSAYKTGYQDEAESDFEEQLYQREIKGKLMTSCPHCNEEVLAIAAKCRYCGGDLVKPEIEHMPALSLVDPVQPMNPTDLIIDMENDGLALDPKPIDNDQIDLRSAVWVFGILVLVGLSYFFMK
jgi:hypothetical protein